jgi:hypothetical protein
MSVSFEYCTLLGRGLCGGLITRPEDSYRVRCVSERDCEASIMRRPRPTGGCCAIGKKTTHHSIYPEHNIFVTVLKACIRSQSCWIIKRRVYSYGQSIIQ